MKIDRLDHLVLTVANVERTSDFYSRILGMDVRSFGDDRKALCFGNQKINLHQLGEEIDPKAIKPTAGSGDLCFITSNPIEDLLPILKEHQVTIETGGIVQRTGATGRIKSIYFRDPDGNLLEISNYY